MPHRPLDSEAADGVLTPDAGNAPSTTAIRRNAADSDSDSASSDSDSAGAAAKATPTPPSPLTAVRNRQSASLFGSLPGASSRPGAPALHAAPPTSLQSDLAALPSPSGPPARRSGDGYNGSAQNDQFISEAAGRHRNSLRGLVARACGGVEDYDHQRRLRASAAVSEAEAADEPEADDAAAAAADGEADARTLPRARIATTRAAPSARWPAAHATAAGPTTTPATWSTGRPTVIPPHGQHLPRTTSGASPLAPRAGSARRRLGPSAR